MNGWPKDPLYHWKPTGKLSELTYGMSLEEEALLAKHFTFGTPASTLAEILTECGYPISETTIKAQRRKNKIGT